MTIQARAKSLAAAARGVAIDIDSQKLFPLGFQCWIDGVSPGCTMGHVFHRGGFKPVANGAIGQMALIMEGNVPEGVANAMAGVMATSDGYAREHTDPIYAEEYRERLVNAIDKLAHELDKPIPRVKEKAGQDISSVAFMQPKQSQKKGRRQ